MSAGTAMALAEQGVTPLNFIYACSLCCASFADVYEGHNESVRGLSDGINPKERLVTKLYLATCCHVFCSSHLEDGGPPFHPEGQRPKAPCPVCTREKGDRGLRELYSVRGFTKGEYDPQIPPSWFTAPPIRLDGSGKEMEALRFQYIALIRYCQNTHAARKPTQRALVEAERNLTRMQDLVSEQHDKVLSLQRENQQLQAEAEHWRNLDVHPRDLETFRANKTAIRHYLKLVPVLLEQNENMRERLTSLGFARAMQPILDFQGLNPDVFDSDETFPEHYTGDVKEMARKTTSSHTVGRSAHTSAGVATAPLSPLGQRPLKRQRQESPHSLEMQPTHPTSREAMPPPPKPILRIQSMGKIIPAIRKKLTHPRSTSSQEIANQDNGDRPAVEEEHWQTTQKGHQVLRHDPRGATPYMSGALPIDARYETTRSRESKLLSSVGIENGRSDFTFEATSPIKATEQVAALQPVRLPAKPSYIRLMDGLSQDKDVELELRDPREGDTRKYRNSQMPSEYSSAHPRWHPPAVQTKKKFWNLGRPFLHQSPHRSSPMPQTPVDREPAGSSENSGYRGYYETLHDPGSPALLPNQQPDHQVENVVSPFFNGRRRQAPLQSLPGLAEPKASSNLSGAFQSQRPRMTVAHTDWREPPSLNGLSFFDSPVNARNEVIQQPNKRNLVEMYPPSRNDTNRSVNSRGFIIRPDAACSRFVSDSGYGSSHTKPDNSRLAPLPTQSAIPFPSSRSNSFARASRSYPARPPVASSRSPVRVRHQWEPLQRAGVRSSRQSFDNAIGSRFVGPSRNLVSSAGRRSIRR